MSTKKLAKSGLVFILSAIFAFKSSAQLTAAFSANPTSGCAPQVVNFTDLSTGNPTSWRWDLGNGTISFLRNPSTTYFNPGQYNVKLVVRNGSGNSDSIVKVQYITIYALPTVDFDASPRTGCFPLPVQFTDLSTTNSGTITQWQWDFGDGNFGNTQNPVHTYTAAGNYNVSLVVTTSNGCSKVITKTQYINIASGVTADFSNTLATSCTPPVNIDFQNNSTGTGTLTYLWNFGDGSTSTQLNPSHIYTTSGSYTIQLIVTNSNGCRDTIIKPNAVSVGTTVTMFTAPDSICVGVNVPFLNTSNPVPALSNWDFGDGTSATAFLPVKSYNTAGVYHVKLVNNFGACTDSISRTITVLPAPVVNFTTNDTSSCKAPFTVQFTNLSTGGATYEWLFGDGGSSTLANPSHTYNAAGIYPVRLNVTSSLGCRSSLVKQQYIKIVLPVANINNLPQEGCAPFTWTFTSTITSSEPVTGYQWDFGDGGTSTLANPTHIYGAGTFTVKLIITTASGCSDTVIVNNGIKTGTKPTANFSANPRNACAEMAISFQDQSGTPVDTWLWDFGDGGTSTFQNPSHQYSDTGYFTVQLIVWNNGCPDTIKYVDYIHIDPPIANFTVASVCNDPLKRTFTDLSIGADEYLWNFGDGNTSTIPSPVHVYATPGVYVVTLLVRNLHTGCSYTKTVSEHVISENVDFTASDTAVCRKTTVYFTSVGMDSLNIASFNWTFGDGSSGTGANPSHTYNISGTYDVSLIITDLNGCKDTLVKPHYIRVNGPVANFASSTNGTCLLSTIVFSDSSTNDGIHPIVQWTWNYGDGTVQTLSSGPFQHNYTTPGIYTVTLTVTDNSGCSDSLVRTSVITISKPVANFTADTLSCPGVSLLFLNSSTGPGLTYNWSFGDGGISIDANPRHTYTADGWYTITLVIHDQYGCSDSITKVNYVRIVSPTPDFTVSDSVGTCPPLIVTFTNTSQNYVSQTWDFGDGTSTSNPAPSHFYNIPGTYMASLTVTGPGGCTATKQLPITVRGPYGTFTYGPLVGCRPLSVNFVATTQDRVSFVWDFDDGSTLATSDSVVSHTYTIAGSYVPKMILLDAGGCVVPITGPDTIRVNGVDVDMNFNTPTLCDKGTVQFTNASVSNDGFAGYLWDFGDGNTSTAVNPSHLYNATGIYFPSLVVTTLSGCIDSVRSTVPVKIVASPQAVIGQTANGCTPVTISFDASLAVPDTSAINWQWTFGNGNTSALINPPAQTYTVAGTYPVNLVATNSSGCKDTASSSIEAYALPPVSAGQDTLVCFGTGKTLQATGAVSYNWSPPTGLSCTNCSNPVANPDSLITYSVTGTDIHGCQNTDQVVVSVKYPFIMGNSIGDTICRGTSLRLFASGAYTYSWTPATGLNNPNSATPVASPSVTTLYQVIGTDDKNCFRDTAFVPVTVYDIPTVEAGPDKTINVGQTLDLVPQISADVTKVVWNPTGSIFRSDFPRITIKPRETTTFTVEVSNDGGCTSRDNVTVYVICDGSNVFIPNTFSPNADGANDIFFPRGSGLFSIKTAKVFNRWGEVVYEKNEFMPNNPSAGWDGTYKGRKLNPDVYIYVIEILCDNNTTLTFKGNIALIR